MDEQTHSKERTSGTGQDKMPVQPRWKRWLRPLLNLWYVHPDITILVYASPVVCLGVLVASSRPSTDRLHLRNLFANGRRYHFVGGSEQGFQLQTTSKVLWRRRERTRANATLIARFNRLDDDLTQIHITAHIQLLNMIYSLWLPIFFTPLFLFAIWHHPIVRVLMTVAIYVLAWIAYRYNAAVDAHDMVYFIEKSLEDYIPKTVSELGAHVPHVVESRDGFPDAWEKFYEQHADNP